MPTRRLIGPTIITLILCALWVDHAFFSATQWWSVTNFLSKILTTITKIFGGFFEPAAFWWVGEIAIPGAMILSSIVLLYVSVTRAKVAMSRATPNADEMLTMPLPKFPPTPQSANMTETVVSKPSSEPRKFGLTWKLTTSFGILALLFGATVSMITHSRMAGTLEEEIKRRARLSVTGLSEVAKRYGGGDSELHHAINNYASNHSIAYIYVEDAEGKIIAHMPRELPRFLRRDFPKTAELAIHGVEMEYRGLAVFEMASRVGEPKRGYVHLAIWRDVIREESFRVMRPIIALILVSLFALSAVFAWVVWLVTRPFVELVHYANRISNGDLALDMVIKDESDEIGDLGRSLGRMRSSLYAVLTRIEKAQPTKHS